MFRSNIRFAVVAASAAVALFAVGCKSSDSSDITAAPAGGSSAAASTSAGGSSSGGSPAAAATTVGATEKDFAIELDSSTAPAGSVTFHVTNDGPASHQFVVLKTDDAPDALPKDNDGNADETANGIANAGQIADISAGSSQDLTIDLKPGKYVVICNLPGHYGLGMSAGLTVS